MRDGGCAHVCMCWCFVACRCQITELPKVAKACGYSKTGIKVRCGRTSVARAGMHALRTASPCVEGSSAGYFCGFGSRMRAYCVCSCTSRMDFRTPCMAHAYETLAYTATCACYFVVCG